MSLLGGQFLKACEHVPLSCCLRIFLFSSGGEGKTMELQSDLELQGDLSINVFDRTCVSVFTPCGLRNGLQADLKTCLGES